MIYERIYNTITIFTLLYFISNEREIIILYNIVVNLLLSYYY